MTGDRIFKTGVGVCVCIIHYNTFILLMRERKRGEGRITQLLLHTYNSQLNKTSRLCLCSPLFFCSPPNFCLSKHRPSNWPIKQRNEIKRQKFSDHYDNVALCTPPPPPGLQIQGGNNTRKRGNVQTDPSKTLRRGPIY